MGDILKPRKTILNLASALKQCGKEKSLCQGKQLHHHVCSIGYEDDRYLANWIIQMYGECGSMKEAHAVFDRIECPNYHSWTILLTTYGQHGHLENARALFNGMLERSVISWNAMMSAYIQSSSSRKAIDLYYRMHCEGILPDNVSFVCAADCCSNLIEGKQIHVLIMQSEYDKDLVASTSLLTMYGRFGSVESARTVFVRLQNRDNLCWNAMITAYVQNEYDSEALELFCQMHHSGGEPDAVTLVCLLDGCANLCDLEGGRLIHAIFVDVGTKINHILATALVHMYGKCGNFHDAVYVFARTPHDNVISWNAIISVSAQNGDGKAALGLFSLMELGLIPPDYATFISILNACSHAGLVNLGWYYFDYMSMKYGIPHTIDHYGCVIDLLGRAGLLDEAELLLEKIPIEVDDVTWRSLLGACKIHGDIERAVRIARKCFLLNPEDAAPYVTLFNIHALDELTCTKSHD